MKLNLKLRDFAEGAGGRIVRGDPGETVYSFVTDTRKLAPGGFFWALKGASFDGGIFLPESLKAGARGWIASEEALARQKELPDVVVAVRDTSEALLMLAGYHRSRFDIPVAGVTGSNGKSTTKEMIRSIFSVRGQTCFNAGNLNNQFGLPLSMLKLCPEDKYAIFEMGASHRGDIKTLAERVRPQTGIITNIAPSHLEFFGSLEGVYETKTELIDYISDGGTLVYNADDAMLSGLGKKDLRVDKMSFGQSREADVRASVGLGLCLSFKDELVQVNLPFAGAHNYMNAAAAAACAITFGFTMPEIKYGLEHYKAPKMRMEMRRVGRADIILDAYNSNPQSVNAALNDMEKRAGKHYFVLGSMKELGTFAEKYHRELGERLAGMPHEKVFFAGEEMKYAAEAFRKAGGGEAVYGQTPEDIFDEVRSLIKSEEGVFLIKASRSLKFERVLEGL